MTLEQLADIAKAGLEEEDKLLSGLLSKQVPASAESGSAAKKRAFGRVGRGLSYWLYETTLVYLVWRSWIKEGVPAALDWTVADLSFGEKTASKLSKGRRFDLVVFDDNNIRFAFEAKWWNNSSKGTRAQLRRDANKMRKEPMLAAADKYLLVFWHETAAQTQTHLAEVEGFCRDQNLRLAMPLKTFPASHWVAKPEARHENGLFVIGALQVQG